MGQLYAEIMSLFCSCCSNAFCIMKHNGGGLQGFFFFSFTEIQLTFDIV